MQARLRRILFWLWPPCEASLADRQIAKRKFEAGNKARWDVLLTRIRSALPPDVTKYAELEILAKHIGDMESKRKDTLENRAATYVIGIGIGMSILSILPTLFSDKWLIPATSVYIYGDRRISDRHNLSFSGGLLFDPSSAGCSHRFSLCRLISRLD